MFRIEVGVRDREQAKALIGQVAGEIDDDGGDGDTGDRQGAVEICTELGRGVGQGRKDEHDVTARRELLGPGACHRGRDDDVAVERQMRAVRLDRADRQHRQRARMVQVAHFFPRQLRELMNWHHDPLLRQTLRRYAVRTT
jgi:hypothetical protein